MDGQEFGPYSASEILKLEITDDILVTEKSMSEWLPAVKFDFKDMARKELIENLQSSTKTVSDTSKGYKHTNSFTSKNTTNNFPCEIEYMANFNEGMNSIGCKLIITSDQLIFRVHSLNFGDLSNRVFNIKDIVGYRKGILSFMYISFVDGREIKLTVWKKQEIINELENRKQYLK